MKNILITGGNGFLGSNLARMFLQLGNRILIISNKSNNINDILDNIEFIQYKSFVTHQEAIHSFCPDIVIHTAWCGGNAYKDIHSLDQFKNISTGTDLLNVISVMKKRPIFIGFGSFAEYGILNEKASESDIESPSNMYGMAKYMFKQTSEFICKQNNIDWIWIRPCYIYGYGDVPTRLIPSVISKLLNNDSCVLDECDVTIDYLHINDFCRAIMHIIESKHLGVFNICSSEEYNLRDILILIQKNIMSTSNILFDKKHTRVSLSKYICGSNEKLRQIGWTPTIPIDSGLIRLINEFKQHYKEYDLNDLDGLHPEV